MFNDFCHPHEHKISSINNLFNRLNTYPISKEAKEKELNLIKHTLHNNIMNTIIKHTAPQNKNKKLTRTHNTRK
jgi:hypothetical protein